MYQKLLQDFLDWLHPPLCLGCGLIAQKNISFCESCLGYLKEKQCSFCSQCGFRVPVGLTTLLNCPNCQLVKYPFYKIAVLGEYRGGLRDLILKGKGRSGELLMEAMGVILAKEKHDFLMELGRMEVCSVPSPWLRRLKRGHNPAESLASGLAWKLGWNFSPGILQRSRSSPRQAFLPKTLRIKNMHGAFRSNLRGKNLPEKVLLVDDVMTTGATLIEAVKVLKAGGVSEVFPIVLARTP